MARPSKYKANTKKTVALNLKTSGYLGKIEAEMESNQSRLSLVLGILIVIVVGFLTFNYFNRNKAELGPAQQTQMTQEDVTENNLPGQYTVKDGDTLFKVAQKYYNDGYKFDEIAKANNLTSPDILETNQVLNIPKLENTTDITTPSDSTTTEVPSLSPLPTTEPPLPYINDWGPKITETTYTVVAGDWLSTIAGRAYGDIFSYDKIARANNIPDPNLIEPGMVLVIPK